MRRTCLYSVALANAKISLRAFISSRSSGPEDLLAAVSVRAEDEVYYNSGAAGYSASQYEGDQDIGSECHKRRVQFESVLRKHGKLEKMYKLYEHLAKLDLGRAVTIYAEPLKT